jgi:hypothetical protein
MFSNRLYAVQLLQMGCSKMQNKKAQIKITAKNNVSLLKYNCDAYNGYITSFWCACLSRNVT